MADFQSFSQSTLGSNIIPNSDALDRKIDKQRENFLKGISSTKHGKKEDPTYLYFKFIFDFGQSGEVDPETFLAPSPLFRSSLVEQDYQQLANQAQQQGFNDARDNGGSTINSNQNGGESASNENPVNNSGNGIISDTTDFFYGSKFKDNDIYTPLSAFGVGNNGYMGAEEFLKQRSTQRHKMIKAFQRGLDFINKNSPYYFQSISGLESIVKGGIKNYFKQTGSNKRLGTLTIECLESIDMRISALAELYRKAIYDYTNHRMMLPENLRKFRMYLVVTEIRNVQFTNNINDILNPFNIPSVAQGANFLDSFNSQTGLLNDTEGILGRSTTEPPIPTLENGTNDQYSLQPYAWIYQLDLCEFDFDDTYPFGNTIDNKGGSAVTTSFKINVGKVRDYKIQFNELADILGKDDNLKSMVISDVFGNTTNPYTEHDYVNSVISSTPPTGPNASEYFQQLASNFINNTVADLTNRGISIVQGALLGNIYGLGGLNIGQAANSVQSLVNTFQGGIPNPFTKNDPQSKGFGGPPERQYPTPNLDVYPGVPAAQTENLGNVLPSGSGNSENLSTDVYSNVPGSDLGLPDRQYPKNESDEYKNVPGTDLGVPTYPYNTPPITTDIYGDVPGSDLGLPDRQYPNIQDDQYNNVPGTDLGVPGRVYQEPNEDLYPTSEGSDLGLPDRQYPPSSGDEYSNIPGGDLGVPGRVYTEPNTDLYPTSEGADLGLPDRQYPQANGDEYSDVPGSDLGKPDRLYPEPDGEKDLYPTSEGSDLGLPDRQYPQASGDEYSDVPGRDLGVPDRVYNQNNSDIYPTSEGSDLGLPDRQYPQASGDEYKGVPGRDLGAPGRTYNGINQKVYENNNPEYKEAGGINEYGNSEIIQEQSINKDVYPTNPGSDLGAPDRNYPTNNIREYIEREDKAQEPLGRVYPKTDDFGNLMA